MYKWAKITEVVGGFVVLTGYNDRPASTFHVDTLEAAIDIVTKYLKKEPEAVSIFVEEKISGGERVR